METGTRRVLTTAASSSKKEQFVAFLHQVLKEYEGKLILMVTDNAPIHRSQLVEDFLNELADSLMFVHLPPYSPNLNPIERLGKWLK